MPRLEFQQPRVTFVAGPHSPIGRGSGLKIRQVSVRVRLGARLGPRNALSVVSGCSYVGQSLFLLDNGVLSYTLVRPCSDGLMPLRFLSGPYDAGRGSANRPRRSCRQRQADLLHPCHAAVSPGVLEPEGSMRSVAG